MWCRSSPRTSTVLYTLPLHDALPISAFGAQCGVIGDGCGNAITCGSCDAGVCGGGGVPYRCGGGNSCTPRTCAQDRKSTRLNSSHLGISYAVFCLNKKNETDGLITRA